ncbi:MAG: phospholipid carrier-dependent glycosyltransferase [Acidobacteriota bacterium]
MLGGAALTVRLLFALRQGLDAWPDDDNRIYFDLAAGLLHGEGLSARWPPMLSILEAAVFAITGPSPLAAKGLVLVFAMLIPVQVALLAGHWAGRRAGLIAGALAIVHGPLLAGASSAMTEPVFTVFLLGTLLSLLRSDRDTSVRPRSRRLLLAGLLAGAACLTRPNGLVLVLVVALGFGVAWWRRRGWSGRATVRALLVFLIGVGVFLIPWTVTTHVSDGRFTLTTTGSGPTFLGGNCGESLRLGEGWLPAETCHLLPPEELAELRRGPSWVLSQRLNDVALDDLAAHPEHWWPLLRKKVLGFFGWHAQLGEASTLTWLSLAGSWLLVPFVVHGAWWSWRERKELVLESLLLVAATFVTCLVYWANVRLRSPIDPLLLVFAAVSLARLGGKSIT